MTLHMTAALLLVITTMGFVRARRRPAALVVAVTAVVGLAVSVLLLGPRPWEWPSTPFDFGLVAAIGVLVADMVGLPDGVARWTGIGRRSREWEFDRQLFATYAPLNERLEAAPDRDDPAHGPWARDTVQYGRSVVRRAAGLVPPNREWAELSGRYQIVYEAMLEALERGDQSLNSETEALSNTLARDRAALRQKYRRAGRAG